MVQPVGDLHVEALFMSGGVMFYLSDANQKPMAVDGYAGQATMKGPAGVTVIDLMPMGDHLHAAASLVQGQPANVVLSLTHDGKTTGASFETPRVGLQSHDHTALRGGQVGMWGNFHVEYLPHDGEYRVWVTDAQRNPVPGTISGSVKDGEIAIPLVADETGALVGKGAGAGARPVTIEVTVNGTTLSLGFDAVGGG